MTNYTPLTLRGERGRRERERRGGGVGELHTTLKEKRREGEESEIRKVT